MALPFQIQPFFRYLQVIGTATTGQVYAGRAVGMSAYNLVNPTDTMTRSKYHIRGRGWDGLASKGLQGSYFIFLREQYLTEKEQSKHHGTGAVR